MKKKKNDMKRRTKLSLDDKVVGAIGETIKDMTKARLLIKSVAARGLAENHEH